MSNTQAERVEACQGNCQPHAGSVRLVHVKDGAMDWGFFHYCNEAVRSDTAAGLAVTDAARNTTQQQGG